MHVCVCTFCACVFEQHACTCVYMEKSGGVNVHAGGGAGMCACVSVYVTKLGIGAHAKG